MNPALAPLSWLYDGIGRARNRLYDSGVFKSYQLPTCVISIGNLTVGGTGKTPTTDFFVTLLSEKQVSCAVLSRGYKGSETHVARVPVHGDRAELAARYGDEPVWLAHRHPQVPVYVGRDRYQAGLYLLERDPARVLLLDDAFQHRKLHRNLNIVLIDATERVEEFAVLPSGRARENLYALKRADAVILNKINLAPQERRDQWHQVLSQYLNSDCPVFEFEYLISSLLDPATQRRYLPRELKGERVALFSGLAKPQLFERQILEQLPVQMVKHEKFGDHHLYSEADMAKLMRSGRDCNWLITTEKDATKLRPGWLGKILVTELSLTCQPSTRDQIYEMVARKLA